MDLAKHVWELGTAMNRVAAAQLAPSCNLCPNKADDSVTVEAGNNAEKRVALDLCLGCLIRLETDPNFWTTFGDRIDQLAAERGQVGRVRSEAKDSSKTV